MRTKGQAPRETAEWAYEGLLNAAGLRLALRIGGSSAQL